MMNSEFSRAWRAVRSGLIAATVVLAFAPTLSAQSWQSVNGSAYAGWVKTTNTEQWVTVANLPTGGGSASTDAVSAAVPGMLKTRTTTAVTSGAVSIDLAGVSSVASASDVDVLNGLITAQQVIAIASLAQDRNRLVADADGSAVTGLVVNGVSYGDTPAANTRVNLPGVGYVILNEQTTSKGRGTSFTVNMIHVVLVNSAGVKTGDIVVGSATSADQ